MNIVEKIPHLNPNEVKLYKEGVFWVAYEQSAYYIWQKKGYKATKKMVKTLGQEIVSVGFPQSSYETFRNSITVVLEKDEIYFKIFSVDKTIDTEAFQQWKADLPLTQEIKASHPAIDAGSTGKLGYQEITSQAGNDMGFLFIPEQPVEEEPSEKDEICQKLRDFPLENKTPMECMLFLSELKKIFYLNGNL